MKAAYNLAWVLVMILAIAIVVEAIAGIRDGYTPKPLLGLVAVTVLLSWGLLLWRRGMQR